MPVIEESMIMSQRLHAPDPRARQLYGVEFAPPTAEQLDSFGNLCDGLMRERQALDGLCAELGIAMTKKAVIYQPAAFLAAPLTAEQKSAINHHETSAVANYCIDIQAGLGQVPIKESGERMVYIPDLLTGSGLPASFSETPFHPACGDWAGRQREFWARESFANRLVVMGALLESAGVQLHFEDAFRPVGVQEGLFRRRVDWTRNDHPDWDEDQIVAEAQSKTAVKPKLASHKGGAAIDAQLRDIDTGELLDSGHKYPDGGVLVFPLTPYVTAEQWRTRQLFQVAAGLSDLTLYVGEDWHVSYGDNLASLDENAKVRPGYVAQYGPIKDFDHTTGEVTSVYDTDEADRVFSY
ncbi:MAG TPA: M15 family metallopeptidase [Patescibacteria group bacterium]|nr:M15 family metallopeptidase [Patescibacteria group bacterium]